jgi:hypothetical protein
MEKIKIKSLKEKLLEAVNRVLKSNKLNVTNKIEKTVKKSIKGIVKKTDKQIKLVAKQKVKS